MITIYDVGNTNYYNNGDAVLIPSDCTFKATINGSWILSLTHPFDKEERYKHITEGACVRVTNISCVREIRTGMNIKPQLFRIYNFKKSLTNVTATAYPIGMECQFDVPIDSVNANNETASVVVNKLQAFTNKYALSTNISKSIAAQWANTNLNSILANGKDDCLVKLLSGEICYDNFNISLLNALGEPKQDGDHPVYYGRNISGVNYTKDDSGVVTRLIPRSKDGIRLNGTGYVDSSKISDYSFIKTTYIETPHNLVDTSKTSDSSTAVLTRSIQTQIQTLANTLSHNIYNTAIADRAWEREYLKNHRTEIIEAIQDYCTQNITHEKLNGVVTKAINEGMKWMKDIQKTKWTWHQNETGWWYGSDGSDYAKSEWVYINRKWCWFNAEGYWVEKWDDAGTWDWIQSKDSQNWWYGNDQKYYAHDEWIYQTVSGELKYYWMNEEGWYEDAYTGVSGWTWHAWGDGWWFGEEGASLDDNSKFAHDQWIWIDGTYYFFDSTGYNAPDAKIENYAWDWQEDNQWFWFGNADKSYGANYLESQWCKINNEWYKFNSSGYLIEPSTLITQCIDVYKAGMTSLKTLCETLKTEAYNLLYTNMTNYCQQKFSDGLDTPKLTVNINLVDVSKTTEYEQYRWAEQLCLGDEVRCVDYYHDIITSDERIVSLTYDCLRGCNTAITIGIADSSVAQKIGASGDGKGEPSGGYDMSIIEDRLQDNAEDIAALQLGKQDKLTAGQNITINGNVISATGGVTPNPSGTPTAELNTIEIDNVIYSVGGSPTISTNANISVVQGATSVSRQGRRVIE